MLIREKTSVFRLGCRNSWCDEEWLGPGLQNFLRRCSEVGYVLVIDAA